MKDEPARRIGALLARALVACTLAGAGVAGCSGGGDGEPPEVSAAWQRGEVWNHRDVFFGFDRVAVGSSTDTVGWVTRRSRGDTAALAYSEITADAEPTHVDLPVQDDPAVLIPVHVAIDDEGWAVVAATRDRPNGDNTGLVAWQATRTRARAPEVPSGQQLRPPEGVTGPPELANVGRFDGTTVVAALFDGRPAIWTAPEDTENGASGGGSGATGGRWEAVQPSLGLDEDLINLHVTGDGERLVLAGVDSRSRAHLWTSTDGERWEPVPREDLPGDVGAVGLLAPLADGQVAVGWLADEDSAPWNATRVTVQRLEGEELVDAGAIAAADSQTEEDDDAGVVQVERVDLGGAALSPADRLVVVGTALRPNGDTTPMVWVRDGDEWTATEQPDLASRLDYEFRTVAAASDRLLIGLVTGVSHVDVESWRWQPPTED